MSKLTVFDSDYVEASLIEARPMGVRYHSNGECDFCSSKLAAWSYPAEPFRVTYTDGVLRELVGPWGACESCHRLIETGEWGRLLAKGLSYFTKQGATPTQRKVLKKRIRTMHIEFIRHRTGDAQPQSLNN